MTKDEFIAIDSPVTIGVISPTGQAKTLDSPPLIFKTGSCGWKFKGDVDVTLADGTQLIASLSATLVVHGSKRWEGGKIVWSKDVADAFRRNFGEVPEGVQVEGE